MKRVSLVEEDIGKVLQMTPFFVVSFSTKGRTDTGEGEICFRTLKRRTFSLKNVNTS